MTTTDNIVDADQAHKATTTAIARAALAGVPVYRLATGDFLIVLGVGHQLPDLNALRAFVARLDGMP